MHENWIRRKKKESRPSCAQRGGALFDAFLFSFPTRFSHGLQPDRTEFPVSKTRYHSKKGGARGEIGWWGKKWNVVIVIEVFCARKLLRRDTDQRRSGYVSCLQGEATVCPVSNRWVHQGSSVGGGSWGWRCSFFCIFLFRSAALSARRRGFRFFFSLSLSRFFPPLTLYAARLLAAAI